MARYTHGRFDRWLKQQIFLASSSTTMSRGYQRSQPPRLCQEVVSEEGAGKQIRVKEAIFEGEAIVYNPKTGDYLPF